MNSQKSAQTTQVIGRWEGLTAGDIMTAPAVTVLPEATILEAVRLLLANSISGVPVVDSEGNLAGIVTEKDLLVGGHILAADKVPVSLIMTRHVVSLSAETGLDETAHLMIHLGFKRFPVVCSGEVVGIVSRCDVLRVIEKLNEEQG
ncbi:MAG: CBS domain-containing protein [Planctomycetes bacterium]|nr:CBS domain-containing protein [Planctomycetota bacterium]